MRIQPESVSGKRLRKYGVAAQALRETTILAVFWMPVAAFTLPLPFGGCVLLVREGAIQWDAQGDLMDGIALAPLVHQFCHAYQRQQWGFARYLARHAWSRLAPRGVPLRHRQVERECYLAAQAVQEAHASRQEVEPQSL
ncbi:MAG: hypothetical protein HY533_05490 [Chloroflexi bacterium]|nr:hypothetical protein [Chloroflexota bacterium]